MTTTSMDWSSMWSRLSAGLQVIVVGGGSLSALVRREGLAGEQGAVFRAVVGVDQLNEFPDALGRLLDGPVVADAGDQRAISA